MPVEQRRLDSGGGDGDGGWWSGDAKALPEDIFGLRSSYDSSSSSYSYEFSYFGDTSLDDWDGSSYDFSGDFSSDWFDDDGGDGDDGNDDFAESRNFVGCYEIARMDSVQAYGISHQEMTIEVRVGVTSQQKSPQRVKISKTYYVIQVLVQRALGVPPFLPPPFFIHQQNIVSIAIMFIIIHAYINNIYVCVRYMCYHVLLLFRYLCGNFYSATVSTQDNI